VIRSIRILKYDFTNAQGARFSNHHESEQQGDSTVLVVPELDYIHMGRPEEITVTIEPGDKLNDHPKGSL
jgi:hypothetical protein